MTRTRWALRRGSLWWTGSCWSADVLRAARYEWLTCAVLAMLALGGPEGFEVVPLVGALA